MVKKGSSETTFVCTLCHTGDLNCSNKGWKAVEQHMQNEKHKRISNALKKIIHNLVFQYQQQHLPRPLQI